MSKGEGECVFCVLISMCKYFNMLNCSYYVAVSVSFADVEVEVEAIVHVAGDDGNDDVTTSMNIEAVSFYNDLVNQTSKESVEHVLMRRNLKLLGIFYATVLLYEGNIIHMI